MVTQLSNREIGVGAAHSHAASSAMQPDAGGVRIATLCNSPGILVSRKILIALSTFFPKLLVFNINTCLLLYGARLVRPSD